jgi:hypothetical protein
VKSFSSLAERTAVIGSETTLIGSNNGLVLS